MAKLSLNGTFNYPIELYQTLVVNGNSSFRSTVNHGQLNYAEGQHSFVSGEACSGMNDYNWAFGKETAASGAFSIAAGYGCESNADFSISLGYKSLTKYGDDLSFTWQGTSTSDNIDYSSKGAGTFNINPNDGLSGFYVGENTMVEHIKDYAYEKMGEIGISHDGDVLNISDDVEFGNPVSFSSNVTIPSGATLSISGNTSLSGTMTNPDNIPNVGYVDTLVSKSVNNVDEYITDTNNLSASASKSFAVSAVTSEIERLASEEGNMTLRGSYSFSGTVNLTSADMKVPEPASIEENNVNVPATERFTRNVATSAISSILRGQNHYTGFNTFNGLGAESNSMVVLSSADTFIKEPPLIADYKDYTLSENVPATIRYAKGMVNAFKAEGGTFEGQVAFNRSPTFPNGLELSGNPVLVATAPTSSNDRSVASTAFVKNAIAEAMGTSMEAPSNILLSTVGRDTNDRTNVSLNDDVDDGHVLFEMKFVDYRIDEHGWKPMGAVIHASECPEAYEHILNECDDRNLSIEVFGSIEFPCFESEDGHKIVDMDDSLSVDEVYESTGVAWYYIIDRNEQTITLPRSKSVMGAGMPSVKPYFFCR